MLLARLAGEKGSAMPWFMTSFRSSWDSLMIIIVLFTVPRCPSLSLIPNHLHKGDQLNDLYKTAAPRLYHDGNLRLDLFCTLITSIPNGEQEIYDLRSRRSTSTDRGSGWISSRAFR